MPPKQAAQRTIHNGTIIEVIEGDITTFQVDAIVNAANPALRGGGGIDSAIHRAASPNLLAELTANLPGDPAGVVGGTYSTGSHNIDTASHIVHAIGPDWRDVAERNVAPEQLRNAYTNSLLEAVNNGDRGIAFPTISTGIFAFPRERATDITLNAMRAFLDGVGRGQFERVVFLIFGDVDLDAYNVRFRTAFPGAVDCDDIGDIDDHDTDFDEEQFFLEDDQQEDEDDAEEEENGGEDMDGAGGDDGGQESTQIDPEDGDDDQESSEDGEEHAPPSPESDVSSEHSELDAMSDEPSAQISISSDDEGSPMEYSDTSAEEDSSDEELPEDISEGNGRQNPGTPSPPAPAPPVAAPRRRTCGDNGGRTKAGAPCGNAPVIGSLRCRFHQNR